MSSILRSMERNIIKKNLEKKNISRKKSFKQNWGEYRDNKYITRDEDGNVISDNTPRDTTKRRQIHYDDKNQYFGLFSFVESLKNSKEEAVENPE